MDTYWSPEPIVGYRVWNVFRDRMQGFHSVWGEPQFSASCTLLDPDTAAPHLDERCECGVYAAKDTSWLAEHFAGTAGPRVAMGRVELTGRVIEHTDGYRAQEARVVEIAIRTHDGVVHFDDAADIGSLFADPHGTIDAYNGRRFARTTDLADLVEN